MSVINDLPIELYELIFKNLSIDDLFNCRLVNKKFKYSTYNCVYKVVVGELNLLSYNWNYNNELINLDDIIGFECFKTIKKLSIFNLGVSLKYLRINSDFSKEQSDLKELSNSNNLINLECLEIFSTQSHYLLLKINLKNLKYFAFDNCNQNLELNIPKLERIQFKNINYVCIKSNPETIKHLITNDYDDQLKQFKNLEIIEFINVNINSHLNENLLSFFQNLKLLKIEIKAKEDFSAIKDSLIKILNNRMKLNKEIDIYLLGVKIINIDKLEEFKSCKYIIEYQINNYELLDFNLYQFKLFYSELTNSIINLRDNLPSTFFNKFLNISDVDVFASKCNRPIDADNLNWFLNNLKCLKQLQINSIPFDQYFFDNLPNTIMNLKIWDTNSPTLYQNINFNFILKFTILIGFILDGNDIDIDLFDLALTSFSNLKYLKEFKFNFKEEKIEINRENKYFKLNTEKIRGELNYEQLEYKLNEIKLEKNNCI